MPARKPPAAEKHGAALRAARLASGLTVESTAERAGVGASYLSRAENNIVTPTSTWMLNMLLFYANYIADRFAKQTEMSSAALAHGNPAVNEVRA